MASMTNPNKGDNDINECLMLCRCLGDMGGSWLAGLCKAKTLFRMPQRASSRPVTGKSDWKTPPLKYPEVGIVCGRGKTDMLTSNFLMPPPTRAAYANGGARAGSRADGGGVGIRSAGIVEGFWRLQQRRCELDVRDVDVER